MTSSTSTSEPDAASARRFRRWAIVAASTFFGGAALLFVILLAVDPYDSARFPNLGIVGVSDNNLRTSNVSRARDQHFDTAIFGSSTGTAIDPNRLAAQTGLRITQLAFSHGDPPEILSVMDWFLAHHQHAANVILMADDNWCSGDPALPQRYPFPFWLYGSDAGYLGGLLNWKTFDRVVWRLQLAFGKRRPNDQVGYLPYHSDNEYVASPQIPPDLSEPEAAARFVWIERLASSLQRLPPGGSVQVVLTPAYFDFLPPPGSRQAERLDRCKRALSAVIAGPPGGARRGSFIDYRLDTPDMHVRADFYDRIHYRDPLARRIEDRMAAALAARPAAAIQSDARTNDASRP